MDFAPRDKFSVIDAFVLHTMIAQTGLIGSPIIPTPGSVSRFNPTRDTEGSSSGLSLDPSAGAAVPSPFNLDACFKMGEGFEG